MWISAFRAQPICSRRLKAGEEFLAFVLIAAPRSPALAKDHLPHPDFHSEVGLFVE
jgi:hypothetical protein